MVLILIMIVIEEEFFSDLRGHYTAVDQFIVKIVLKTAVFIFFGMVADCRFDRVLMNISDDFEHLGIGVDRTAFIARLKEDADSRVFLVIPVYEAGDDMLKNLIKRHRPRFDQKMDMVGHQAVGDDFVITKALILVQSFQKLIIIVIIFENPLLVYTAINNVIDIEGTSIARRS